MFCGELPCKSVGSSHGDFFPTNKIMGCIKDCELMDNYINFLERTVSADYTNEMEFTGETDTWLYEQIIQKNIMPLDATYFGAKKENGKPVLIDDLLGDNDDFTLSSNAYGLYIPANDILKRTNLQWFARLSAEQVLESNTVVARQLLLCNE